MDDVPVWTLAGVIVGALLGGGAQIVADALRARRDEGARRELARRDVYSRFLAAVRHAYVTRWEPSFTMVAQPLQLDVAQRPDDWITWAEALRQGELALDVAVADVQLVGPPAVADKAVEIERFVSKNKELTSEEGHAGLERHISLFVTLAQPFTGIGSGRPR